MVIHPFSISTLKDILNDFNGDYSPEDILCLYLITGGVAKYITRRRLTYLRIWKGLWHLFLNSSIDCLRKDYPERN